MGPGGETLNQFEHILQTYGHHIKNLGWYCFGISNFRDVSKDAKKV